MKTSIELRKDQVEALLGGSLNQIYIPFNQKAKTIQRDPNRQDEVWEDENGKLCKPPYNSGQIVKLKEDFFPDPPMDDTWDYYSFTDGKIVNLKEIPDKFQSPKYVIYRASWTGIELQWLRAHKMPSWAVRFEIVLRNIEPVKIQWTDIEIGINRNKKVCTEIQDYWNYWVWRYDIGAIKEL